MRGQATEKRYLAKEWGLSLPSDPHVTHRSARFGDAGLQVPRLLDGVSSRGPFASSMCTHVACLPHICLQMFPGFPRTPSHQGSRTQLTSQPWGVVPREDLSLGLSSTHHTCLSPLPCLLPSPPPALLLGSSRFFPFVTQGS